MDTFSNLIRSYAGAMLRPVIDVFTRQIGATPWPFIDVPLEDPKNQIRLLELQPGQGDDEIVGKLSMHPRSDLPEFEAISYTWGDRTRSKTIELNGTPFSITFNSWTALKQVRLSTVSRLLWMDTMCIDQTNDDERGAQVQGIESVFRCAKRALISLDGVGNDAEFLFAWVRKFNELRDDRESEDISNVSPEHMTLVKKVIQVLASGSTQYRLNDEQKIKSHEATVISYIDWKRAIISANLERQLDRLLRAVDAFGRCSYWRRLWVYPELALSSDNIVFYGPSNCSMRLWYRFLSVVMPLETHAIDLALIEAFRTTTAAEFAFASFMLPFGQFAKKIKPVDELLHSIQRSHLSTPSSPRGFGGVSMFKLREMQCAEARDRIFALIPLIDWQRWDLNPIIVDYKKNRVDLALECLTFCEDVSDILYLLEALEIGCQHNDNDVANFLRCRQQITPNPNKNEEYKTDKDCRCSSPEFVKYVRFKDILSGSYFTIDQDLNGQRKAGDDRGLEAYVRLPDSFKLEETEPYLRMVSAGYIPILGPVSAMLPGRMAAIVPADASPGDVVYMFDGTFAGRASLYEGLVMRGNEHGVYRIVGYALVSRNLDFVPTREYRHDLVFEPRFDVNDVLAFALQSLCLTETCSQHLGSLSNIDKSACCLLSTAPTRVPYSSHVLKNSIPYCDRRKGGDPFGVICGMCGGLLDEVYQEKNRRIMDWPPRIDSERFSEGDEAFF